MIRNADIVRDYIRDNVLPTYNPAIEWDESQSPFDLDEPVIYCAQDGGLIDGFILNAPVEVYVFSPLNIKASELSSLYDDAISAFNYCKANPSVSDDLKLVIDAGMTKPLYTGQNRRYFRFNVLCYTL